MKKLAIIISLLLISIFSQAQTVKFWASKITNDSTDIILDNPIKIELNENVLLIGDTIIYIGNIKTDYMKYTVTHILTARDGCKTLFYVIEGTDIWLTGNFKYHLEAPVLIKNKIKYVYFKQP